MPLVNHTLSIDARTIFLKSLEECSVRQAFTHKLHSETIDLTHITRIIVIAAGKAASTMLDAFLEICPRPQGCDIQGIVIAPSAPAQPRPGFAYFAGGHPLPNQESFAGAQAALALLASAAGSDTERTFCFFLISGGASAMMELPLDPQISLADTAGFHKALVGSGASIAEINCIRKHFSAVKGGRLALAAGQIRHLSILLSDVPAGHLDALSSGPTLADSTTVQQCREILHRFNLHLQFPSSVLHFFTSSRLPETPKPGDFRENILLLLSSDDLQDAARRHAQDLGYVTFVDNTCDDWDYRDAAEYLLQRVRALQQQHPRICLLSAGEVTVQMPHSSQNATHDSQLAGSGIGGRNLHFTLHCASRLHPEERITILSAGSDGVDGNSPATGAVADASMISSHRAEALQALAEFNSFPWFDRLGATIVTGPTGNNLRDLRILLAETTP